MRLALVDEGLVGDEADAMLNTWEVSYFKSPGARVFCVVPRAWTDRVLPLSISREGKALPDRQIVRAMIGRLELITPQQRDLIKTVATPPAGLSAKETLDAQLEAYRALGRFRDALILDEARRKPTDALTTLIDYQSLRG
jgi:hypothetical protein